MKKIVVIILFSVFLLLAGCADGSDEISSLAFPASDYVQIPDIDALTIDSEALALSEDDIRSIIHMNLSYNGIYKTIEDRAIPTADDIVVLNLTFSVSDAILLQEERLVYHMGSLIYPQEFEDAVLSMSVGNTTTLAITFPENYPDETFAGLSGTFAVHLHNILGYIDFDDEALILKHYGCRTMEEVKAKITEASNKIVILDHVLNHLIETCHINEFPPQGISYVEETLQSYARSAKESGLSLDTYLSEIWNTDSQTLEHDLCAFYSEFLLLKAITESEQVCYTTKDFYKTAETIAKEDNLSVSEVLQYYDTLTICYEMLSEDAKEILFNHITIT